MKRTMTIVMREREKPRRNIKEIPPKVIEYETLEDAEKQAKEFWKEHGSKEEWYAYLTVDSGVHF